MRRAGAVIVNRRGADVAAHFGSSAAELAVCIQTVGLADRSDLGKILVTGKAAGVAQLVRRMTETSLAAEGVVLSDGAWWCAAAPDRVIVVCEPTTCGRLLDMLRTQARRLPGVEVTDGSTAWNAIAVVGRSAMQLLAALKALGPDGAVRTAAPFGRATIAGAEVHVLLQSDRRALLVVEAFGAGRVWREVEDAGRPLGLSLVGADAVHRFSLLDRAAMGQRVVATAR